MGTARELPWLPLDLVLAAVPAMEERGVSEVARSPRGFVAAYEAAGGDPDQLGLTPSETPGRDPYPWRDRRNEFNARHVAQIQGEPLWETYKGERWPTRRHLALVAWAYSPDPDGLRKWLEKRGSASTRPFDLWASIRRQERLSR